MIKLASPSQSLWNALWIHALPQNVEMERSRNNYNFRLKYITAHFLTPQVESGEECDPPIDANPVEKKCCTIDCKKVESEQCELSDETRDAALAYPSNDAFYFFQGSHYIKTRSVLLL